MNNQDVVLFHHKKEVVSQLSHEATIRIKNGFLKGNLKEVAATVAETVGYPVDKYGMSNPKIEPKQDTDLYVVTWLSNPTPN